MPIRFTDEQKTQWLARAATCALRLNDWITLVLTREAGKPLHVPPLVVPLKNGGGYRARR